MSSVIIVGAPRSGTNMLRSLLCEADGYATWPCDEINYIWRHGNARYPSDVFSEDLARPEVSSYIRRQFSWVRRRYGVPVVVEKTCANSLRVEFVERVIDEPKYIFIYRDGIDAVGSALKRWRANMDLGYILQKSRFVPITDLPYYASRYLGNRIARVLSKERQLSIWGPILPDMNALKAMYSLPELCALQWKACVEYARMGFASIPESRVHSVAYESLVGDKDASVASIEEFLELPQGTLRTSRTFERINSVSVGLGRGELPPDVLERAMEHIKPTLIQLGYE